MSRVPRLVHVTDRLRAQRPLPDLAALAVSGGVDLVQVRERDLLEDELRPVVEAVVAAVGDHSRVSVNENMAVARDLGVGLHLPESGTNLSDARTVLGPDTLIGRSVHSSEAARESSGADYLIAGHVYATSSKPGRPPIGLDGLKRILDAAPCPVLAIGGITAKNVRSVLEAGAYGAAVISAINNADDPESAARAIREQFKEIPVETTAAKVETTINGKPVVLDEGTTIQQFLHAKGYQDRLVVVELNESILPRDRYPSTVLTTGDRVEIVHFVGGG